MSPKSIYIRCPIELDGTVVSIIPLNDTVGIPFPVFPAIEAQAQEHDGTRMVIVPQIPTPRSQYNKDGQRNAPRDQDSIKGAVGFWALGKKMGKGGGRAIPEVHTAGMCGLGSLRPVVCGTALFH